MFSEKEKEKRFGNSVNITHTFQIKEKTWNPTSLIVYFSTFQIENCNCALNTTTLGSFAEHSVSTFALTHMSLLSVCVYGRTDRTGEKRIWSSSSYNNILTFPTGWGEGNRTGARAQTLSLHRARAFCDISKNDKLKKIINNFYIVSCLIHFQRGSNLLH